MNLVVLCPSPLLDSRPLLFRNRRNPGSPGGAPRRLAVDADDPFPGSVHRTLNRTPKWNCFKY